MRKTLISVSLLVQLAFNSLSLLANQPLPESKDSIRIDSTINPIETIESKFWQNNSLNRLDQVLQKVGGIEINENGLLVRTGNHEFTIHQTHNSSSNYSILENGIPSFRLEEGFQDWSNFNLDSYEKIEVHKSRDNARYSAQNSRGYINLIRKKPSTEPTIKVSFYTGLSNEKKEFDYGTYYSYQDSLGNMIVDTILNGSRQFYYQDTLLINTPSQDYLFYYKDTIINDSLYHITLPPKPRDDIDAELINDSIPSNYIGKSDKLMLEQITSIYYAQQIKSLAITSNINFTSLHQLKNESALPKTKYKPPTKLNAELNLTFSPKKHKNLYIGLYSKVSDRNSKLNNLDYNYYPSYIEPNWEGPNLFKPNLEPTNIEPTNIEFSYSQTQYQLLQHNSYFIAPIKLKIDLVNQIQNQTTKYKQVRLLYGNYFSRPVNKKLNYFTEIRLLKSIPKIGLEIEAGLSHSKTLDKLINKETNSDIFWPVKNKKTSYYFSLEQYIAKILNLNLGFRWEPIYNNAKANRQPFINASLSTKRIKNTFLSININQSFTSRSDYDNITYLARKFDEKKRNTTIELTTSYNLRIKRNLLTFSASPFLYTINDVKKYDFVVATLYRFYPLTIESEINVSEPAIRPRTGYVVEIEKKDFGLNKLVGLELNWNSIIQIGNSKLNSNITYAYSKHLFNYKEVFQNIQLGSIFSPPSNGFVINALDRYSKDRSSHTLKMNISLTLNSFEMGIGIRSYKLQAYNKTHPDIFNAPYYFDPPPHSGFKTIADINFSYNITPQANIAFSVSNLSGKRPLYNYGTVETYRQYGIRYTQDLSKIL